MSGTRVTTTRLPLITPRTMPRTITPTMTAMANSSLWPFMRDGRDHAGQGHHRADRQVDPARDHHDRLADGRQREWQDGDREALDPGHPIRRLDGLREGEEDDEEDDEPEGPGVLPPPGGERIDGTAPRADHGVGRGAHGRRPAAGSARLGGALGPRLASTVGRPRRRRRPQPRSPPASRHPIGGGTRRAAASARPRRPRSISSTTRPPKMTMARSQTSCTSFSSDV